MRVVMFYHSLVSDWNHGNAHFLRGVCAELIHRGYEVRIYEPKEGWSRSCLIADHGPDTVAEFQHAFPRLCSDEYDERELDLDQATEGADLVLVHEWNTPEMVRRIGEHRARSHRYRLLFHDTHHRMVSDPKGMSRYELKNYDGVLAFGKVIAEMYLARGVTQNAWTWHEAADTRVFRPVPGEKKTGDLIWIGNWGDEERTEELQEFLLEPSRRLGLRTEMHGVRYPESARRMLADAGIGYRGWIANFRVPEVFSRFRVTVHVPRRPYARALPGIPTIRVFEALACGIPLISAPWEDAEGLFRPGEDFLIARNGEEMERLLRAVLTDPELAGELARRGRRAIEQRHTCAHRVDELLDIYGILKGQRR